MRLGIATGLKHSSPEEWARQLKGHGVGSVLFPVNSNQQEKEILAYKAAAEREQLLIAEVGIWRNAISLDEQERNENMDWSIAQLKLADRVGARCCVNVAGAAGEKWDGAYRENFSQKTWERTVRMIQEVIDEAKPQNTFFTIEPMPWMVPSGPEEYLRLLEDVNRERFAVHMDIINMINTPDRYFNMEMFTKKSFDLLGPYIKSCHVKDISLLEQYTFQLRECACGEGEYPLEIYAQLASELDPDMPFIIEHLDSDEAYLESLAYVKHRLASV